MLFDHRNMLALDTLWYAAMCAESVLLKHVNVGRYCSLGSARHPGSLAASSRVRFHKLAMTCTASARRQCVVRAIE